MALHDAYARVTPYELALPSLEFGAERFGRVAEEAETQGFPEHLTDVRAFSLLGEVGAMLQEIRPSDDPAERIEQYGLLLFHAFHFWRHDFPLVLVPLPVVREVVRGADAEAPALDASGSVYLQLPQHLVWIPGDPAPESLDGIFLTWHDGRLTAMAVAGVTRTRPGVITLPLPPLPLDRLPALATQTMRADAEDFSTTMPGAELDGLYGVESAGEVLKLVARLLPRLEDADDGERPREPEGPPEPSALDYRVL